MARNGLRLHGWMSASISNGPGVRAVLWMQGCTLGCPGCYNPQTHPSAGGRVVPAAVVVRWLQRLERGHEIEGVSITGGEPFQQRPVLEELLGALRSQTQLSVLAFTGYSWQEVRRFRQRGRLLAGIDVLIAGRYDQTHRQSSSLLGSANQTIHLLTNRYRLDDIRQIPPTEVILLPTGEVCSTGIDPLVFSR